MVPTVDINSIQVGRLLGSGGFCSVYDASTEEDLNILLSKRKVEKNQDHLPCLGPLSYFFSEQQPCHRQGECVTSSESSIASLESSSSSSSTVAAMTTRTSNSLCTTTRTIDSSQSSSSYYALKTLKPAVLQSPKQRQAATADLTHEATLLSQLPFHPHVIQLKAVSEDFWEQEEEQEQHRRYMLLEKLQCTLDYRLHLWSQVLKQELPGRYWRGRNRRDDLVSIEADRVQQAGVVGITKAMEFLHSHDIVFRDLKPSNIGFAPDGTVRLFDFGLARYLPRPSEGDSKNNRYCMSYVGTVRYMAPEMVSKECSYNQSVDVYAFGIVLWEICSLEMPFGKPKSTDQLEKWVRTGKHRPCLRQVAAPSLRRLIASCLDSNPDQRPPFDKVVVELAHHVRN